MTRITFILFLIASSAYGQKIVSSKPFAWPTWEETPPWIKQRLQQQEYDDLRMGRSAHFDELTYTSDGLKVNGFIFSPADRSSKHPVIVYNRPGVGLDAAISKNSFRMLYEMYRCVEKGFVVVASQYRGVGGSEGKDEVGGADVNDVMNLHELIGGLAHADTSKIFMMGTSRGAGMTLQAIRAGFPIKAAAVVGTPTDWEAQLQYNTDIGEKYWPDYLKKRDEHIRSRSAIHWPEAIDVPVLFVHGAADQAVSVDQVYRLAPLLQKHRKDYEIIVYANDNHFVTNHLDEKMDAILEWFSEHLRDPKQKPVSDEEAIRAIFADAEKGYNENNAEIILKHYSKDLLVTYPETPDMDYNGFVKAYEAMMANTGGPKKKIVAEIDEIIVDGDMAFVRMNWNTTIYRDTGDMLRKARDLQVFRKENGEWKFFRGMWFHEKPTVKGK